LFENLVAMLKYLKPKCINSILPDDVDGIDEKNIHPELVINADETSVPCVPTDSHTMAPTGDKVVNIL